MSVKYILGLPDKIDRVEAVYPIKLKDYELFSQHSSVLQISKQVFLEDVQHLPLMDLIVFGLKDLEILKSFEVVFSLSLRKKVKYYINGNHHGFYNESEVCIIDNTNFEAVRESIMRHDLVFEPKVFKNKIVQEWANKVLKARAKNSKISIEEMISIVNVYSGVSYEEIGEYTIYQLHASFNRIAKIIAYESTIKFRAAGASNIAIEDYMEKVNLHKNPYDDLFVDNNKLSNINQSMK